MLTLSVVEDDRLFAELLVHSIQATKKLRLLSVYFKAEDAINHLPKEKPNVVLMDIRMPGMNGIECTDWLRRLSPPLNTRVLILTDHSDNESVFGALKAGADGYLLKDHVSTREIYDAIVEVNVGGAPMDRWIARRVIKYFHQPIHRAHGLTARESEVLEFLSGGSMYKEIAHELLISLNTVRKHIGSIYSKLQVRSRMEALAAIRLPPSTTSRCNSPSPAKM